MVAWSKTSMGTCFMAILFVLTTPIFFVITYPLKVNKELGIEKKSMTSYSSWFWQHFFSRIIFLQLKALYPLFDRHDTHSISFGVFLEF